MENLLTLMNETVRWLSPCDIFSTNRAGVGARFALSLVRSHDNTLFKPGTWYVASVPRESAAFEAGLQPYDTLIEVRSQEI